MTPRAGLPLVAAALAVTTTAATLWRAPPPMLVWNTTASAPIGLYQVGRADPLHRGDLVVARPSGPLAAFLAERGYLPLGVPLIKPVAALPGQRVCRVGSAVMIDGAVAAQARRRDRWGRALPVWQGCRTIARGEVFLMNPARQDSLDGRYFGAVAATSVVGRARPLWVSPGRVDPGAPVRRQP
ncbi:MAG: S26 family signal peptidase [Phenylobacterium sp.]|uniref:S26 family signal peptidase n=1 Tax=Phenylobacterium sp. TaxID=1871053 RepID=UPI0027323F97|nr:S26 family signal peptidase [Phenylobacterium sp.]MDP3748833.1 S26 family signal peptidase [Phenylobacterium sp.]